MKIVFTGGGTGGHFYPIIAVAEAINDIVDREKLTQVKLYFFSNSEYDKKALLEQQIEYRHIPAGKLRIYPSIQNITDLFKTFIGTAKAIVALFSVFPDVVFTKGGYSSFPTLVAARLLGIPVFVHESDSAPGRVTKWAGKFAYRIGVSYPEAVKFFNAKKVAHTGQPIRKSIAEATTVGAYEYLQLEHDTPVLFILGGSQGAQIINNAILNILPQLVEKYQVIHQVGEKNIQDIELETKEILKNSATAYRYKPLGFLNPLAMKMSAGVSHLIISRAGSSLFEIAGWGKPAIIIPITNSHGNHQRENAFNYARAGAGVVIEESNLTPTILLHEIDRIITEPAIHEEMSKNAKAFSGGSAAMVIAQELVDIGLKHQE